MLRKLYYIYLLCSVVLIIFAFRAFAVSYTYEMCNQAVKDKLPEAINICSAVASDRGAENRELASKKMAELYLNGFQANMPPNFKEAVKWLKISASEGDVEAKHNLGVIYENGVPNQVEADYEDSLKWYLSAAKDGYGLSQYNLGNIYYNGGLGLRQNNGKALEMYIKAANNGISEAAFMAAAFFEEGLGLQDGADLKYAYQYFYMADKLGDKDAIKHLASLDGKISSAEKEKAIKRAGKILKKVK